MKEKPKVGSVVKFHIMLNDGIRQVLGRVERVYDNAAFINFREKLYTRDWNGLLEATNEEEVLWKFEQ
jgi:hypothetical protein